VSVEKARVREDVSRERGGTMTGPPQLWSVLTGDVLALPAALSWQLWRAIIRARWSASVAWRDAFLRLSRQHVTLTRNLVRDFLGELCTLARLIELIEGLMAEGVLLRRDGRALEEALFARADATGLLRQPPETPQRVPRRLWRSVAEKEER
jgi:hypothetical protein